MLVSTRGRYGLRIMLELAAQYGSGPVLVTSVALNQSLPAKYIHVLVGGLKAAGLVTAVRGPNGGLELARDPARITPLEILEALEGRLSTEEGGPEPSAGRPADSVAREVWADMAAAMETALRRHTLAELAERVRAGAGDAYVI